MNQSGPSAIPTVLEAFYIRCGHLLGQGQSVWYLDPAAPIEPPLRQPPKKERSNTTLLGMLTTLLSTTEEVLFNLYSRVQCILNISFGEDTDCEGYANISQNTSNLRAVRDVRGLKPVSFGIAHRGHGDQGRIAVTRCDRMPKAKSRAIVRARRAKGRKINPKQEKNPHLWEEKCEPEDWFDESALQSTLKL
ncbi:hypothetical protein MMC19_007072 [Ptychographa xylographoides]|nr:hypothetical protein [Ptychographa xylographoides]